jgi:hypothetical protein
MVLSFGFFVYGFVNRKNFKVMNWYTTPNPKPETPNICPIVTLM